MWPRTAAQGAVLKLGASSDQSRFGAAMAKLIFGGANLAPLMEQIGEAAQDEFERSFETGGFGKWPPLKRVTQDIKARRFPGQPIMVRTGTLRDSLIERGAEGNIFEVTALGVNVGTAIPYAYKQHDGEGGTPGRPVVFVSPGLEARMAELAENYLEGLSD